MFAPNERCITLVRLSKTGTLIARDDKDPYSNLLKDYDYYHGTTVGIIIRNGENLYMGWTDESRVHIADDLIVSQVTTETTPYKEEESSRLFHSEMVAEREKEQQERNRKELLDEIISRTFVYNILQGIVDNSDILPLPKGVTLNKQSEYVQYAVADKWLKDTRFGSFTEIIKKGNERVTKGDMLLTTQRISAVQSSVFGGRAYGLGTWENNRGRGDRNITHDCSISDCTLYKANLVEWDKPYERFEIALHSSSWTIGEGERYKDSWSKTTLNDRDFYWYVRGVEPTTNEAGELVYTVGKVDEDGNYTKWVDNTFNNDRIIDYTIKKRWTIHTRHVYVSCEKEDAKWRGTEARANVEVMDGEFINLMYLDSVLLEWVINNRELGGWNVGGAHANYAFAIRYLNMALEHVRKRERVEEENIDAVDESICKNPEWPHILTEFKLEKQVREITPYQAKRFAKWYAENGKG